MRPLTRDDFGLLSRWLAAPHVQQWWRQPSSLEAVEQEYGAAVDGKEPTDVFVVEWDGRSIGIIQRYRLSDYPKSQAVLAVTGTPAEAVSVDYLIGEPDQIGRGIGPQVIERCVADSWVKYPDVSAVVVPVQQENRRSWRALEKVGFERAWSGMLDSDDPSDDGPSYVYVLRRGRG